MAGIVVGVDGSEGSIHALEWAAAEARLRGTALAVVSAWNTPAILYSGAGWGLGLESEVINGLREIATDNLDRICDEHAAVLEGLDAERTVVEGTAAEVLLERAKTADLLVVGSRGHGGFAGLLLGSVSQQCAHHSPCPIVIVPPKAGDDR